MGREEMTFPQKVFPPAPTPSTSFIDLCREQSILFYQRFSVFPIDLCEDLF